MNPRSGSFDMATWTTDRGAAANRAAWGGRKSFEVSDAWRPRPASAATTRATVDEVLEPAGPGVLPAGGYVGVRATTQLARSAAITMRTPWRAIPARPEVSRGATSSPGRRAGGSA